jgi:hypothetical protein
MAAERIDIPAMEAPIERMGGELLEALIDELRIAGASWQQLSKDQQDSVIGRMKNRIRFETERAIHMIAAGARDAARVKIESVTVKEGAKAVLLVNDSVHEVIDYVGQSAVLVMCDPSQFFGGMDDVQGEDDQKPLPLDEQE